jgi:hypothetical protein
VNYNQKLKLWQHLKLHPLEWYQRSRFRLIIKSFKKATKLAIFTNKMQPITVPRSKMSCQILMKPPISQQMVSNKTNEEIKSQLNSLEWARRVDMRQNPPTIATYGNQISPTTMWTLTKTKTLITWWSNSDKTKVTLIARLKLESPWNLMGIVICQKETRLLWWVL